MLSKKERTTLHILETVSPVFNKHGYMGTSMADIKEATGLTKGSIYGNFEDKHHLAIEAFKFNVNRVLGKLDRRIKSKETAMEKLRAITDFYREYYEFTIDFGGCPILNVGVDSNNLSEKLELDLANKVKKAIRNLSRNLAGIIEFGMQTGELRNDLDASLLAGRMIALLQGGSFMTVTMRDKTYLLDMMDHFDRLVETEIRK